MTFEQACQIAHPVQWVVVTTSLECDPIVQGPFATRERANEVQAHERARLERDLGPADLESDDWEVRVQTIVPVITRY